MGRSTYFLDRHYYDDSHSWHGGDPHWVWIKEIATGRERKLGVEPVLGAKALE